ncbi:MAG: lipopolysaccharide transport periplasmic protein LptA [Deltaproteobacteria bacterium]|nr:lipopolysaccharide transport periplasmic protein LptA [Deltaproteobacteria bacterium]
MAFLFLQAQGAAAAGDAQKADAAASALDMRGQAKTVPKKPINVTSDRMETEKTENTVKFSGNVAAEEDFILCSDELHVSYDENREIKEIRATGNVRILRDGKTAASDVALYDKKTRTIILTGKANVTQCAGSVRGEKIIYSFDTDRAVAEGGQGGRVKAAITSQKKCKEDEKANISPPPESAEAWCKKNPALPR